MFYLKYENTGQTDVYVVKATSEAKKLAGVTEFENIKLPGYNIIFNTELKIKNARESLVAFNLLNEYIHWRGDEYIEELYRGYEKLYNLSLEYTMANDRDSDVIKSNFCMQLTNVISLLDIDSIHKYITEVHRLVKPVIIKDEFDMQVETDGLGTKNQTYITEEYYWLMALITIFKATYGPLAQLVYGSSDNAKKHPELQMLDILRQQPLAKHFSFIKLRVYVSTIVEKTFDKDKIGDHRVLSTQLSRDVIPMYYLSKAMFSKMIVLDQLEDPNASDFDIVRYLYRDVNSKIKNDSGNSSEAIRNKNKPNEAEVDGEDKESVIESYRIATDVPPGIAVEMNWATKTVDRILKQLPIKVREVITDDNLRMGIQLSGTFTPDAITNIHLTILGTLFKSIIDPRGLKYLQATNIYNMIALGYAILMGIDNKPLAYMLVSRRTASMEESTMNISSNLNAAKAKGYRDDELSSLYPERYIDSAKGDEKPGDLVILDWVSNRYIEMNKYNWITPSILGVGVKDILISTLKNKLVDFLIDNELLNK